MDWRRRLADYNSAQAAHVSAERLLAAAVDAGETALQAGSQATGSVVLGVALARKRVLRARRRLARATLELTGGRPLEEVLWSLPDDI